MRKPKETERTWNNYNIDKNLEDAWLEDLNSLQVFNLISICEGHISERQRHPHFNLRLKAKHIPLMAGKFDDVSIKLQEKLVILFGNNSTNASIEYKIKLNSSCSNREIRRDLVLSVRSRVARESDEIDQPVRQWFNESISAACQMDAFMEELNAL